MSATECDAFWGGAPAPGDSSEAGRAFARTVSEWGLRLIGRTAEGDRVRVDPTAGKLEFGNRPD